MATNVVILGAGVSGLTTALLLARNETNSVTVVAKHMPGDYDIEYTSPWAGANFMPMSLEKDSRWETRSLPALLQLANEVPEAGIQHQRVRIYRREKNAASGNFSGLFQEKPWFSRLFDDYRELEASELPLGVRSGCEYGTICINTAIYLPWLVGQCRRAGVIFKRAVLSHIREARALHHSQAPADILINASGLLACKLGGVEDKTVYPVRGQIVVVRNEVSPMMVLSGTDVCYMMQRPAGGGTILGGTYEKGNWDPNPNANTAIDIMKRCVKLNPSLTNGEGIEALSIVRHGVGLRPARETGVRIETDHSIFNDCPVVHNYGHAGWGYQGSYGCAERVVELVEEVKQGSIRAKL